LQTVSAKIMLEEEIYFLLECGVTFSEINQILPSKPQQYSNYFFIRKNTY
jgi:hypothetical protein